MRCKLHAVVLHVLAWSSVKGPAQSNFHLHSIGKVSGVRADYEVDFITFFTRLTGTKMGAKFNDEAYLVPIKIDVPKL